MKIKQIFETSDVAGACLISGIALIVTSISAYITVSYCTGSIYDLIGAIGITGIICVGIAILKTIRGRDVIIKREEM